MNNKSSTPKSGFSRWIPIIAGIVALLIVAVIGIALTVSNGYAQNPQASPGRTIGAIAVIMGLVVYFFTKYYIDHKDAAETGESSFGPGASERQMAPSKSNLYNVLGAMLVVLAIFALAIFLVGNVMGVARFQTDQATVLLRFAFVVLGALIAFAVYLATRQNKAWEIGTRQVVWMAIGAALYAVFSWLFNGTVFVVPSLSQVALRPAIAIPMFFGYAFGPWVGFFSGAVGNVFGDALTGFGLSPQWSIANGLIGFIAGLPMLFADKKRSLDVVLIIGAVLAVLAAGLYFLFPTIANLNYYNAANDTFGETQITLLAGGGSILIGLILVLIVRFVFGKNIDIAAAVTWGMLGNILGIGFAAISDIWINGYSPSAAVVGEFLPAAGPNLIFAAILVPLLVVAYAAVQKQSGR